MIEMHNKNVRVGIILILVGVLSGLGTLKIFSGELVLYLFSIGFLGAYFGYRRNVGFLIPGCILASIAVFSSVEQRMPGFDGLYFLLFLGTAFIAVFLIHTLHNSSSWGERYWPLFPGLSLMIIGFLTLAVENKLLRFDLKYLNFVTPAILVIAGAVILINNFVRKNR